MKLTPFESEILDSILWQVEGLRLGRVTLRATRRVQAEPQERQALTPPFRIGEATDFRVCPGFTSPAKFARYRQSRKSASEESPQANVRSDGYESPLRDTSKTSRVGPEHCTLFGD